MKKQITEVPFDQIVGRSSRHEGGCSCSLEERCARHQEMMRKIHGVWNSKHPNLRLMRIIYAHSDGYGAQGYIPAQGYDWSGIRDSTPRAVEQMYELATGKPADDDMATKIAKQYLDIDTLQTLNSDSLDFHEVSVWGLRKALEAAFEAGKKAK